MIALLLLGLAVSVLCVLASIQFLFTGKDTVLSFVEAVEKSVNKIEVQKRKVTK